MIIFTHLCDDLLLHEVNAHGDDPHAQKDVDSPQHQLGVGLGLWDRLIKVVNVGFARDKVSEPDGGESYKSEIETLDKGPIFPC